MDNHFRGTVLYHLNDRFCRFGARIFIPWTTIFATTTSSPIPQLGPAAFPHVSCVSSIPACDNHCHGTTAPHASDHISLPHDTNFHTMDNHFLDTISIHSSDHILRHNSTYTCPMDNHFLDTISIHSSDH